MAVHVGGKGPGHLARTQGLGGIDRSAYMDLRFGWPRSAYWLDGGLYDTFGSVPGATSTGGAGFGQALRNGAWSGSLPDGVPLIGDGGLGVWEARTNSIRNPTALGGSGAAWPTNWSPVSSTTGLTITRIGRVTSANGLPGFAFRVQGTASAATFRIQFEGVGVIAASEGQTHITSARAELLAGTWDNVSTVNVAHIYRNAGNAGVGTARSANTTPENVKEMRTSTSVVAPATTTQLTPEVEIVMSTTLPVDFTVGIYAPNSSLGANINAPPILQTSGLAATRTAMEYSQVLPAGDGTDLITVEYTGGSTTFARSTLSDPMLLPYGASSGGAWVNKEIERITLKAA